MNRMTIAVLAMAVLCACLVALRSAAAQPTTGSNPGSTADPESERENGDLADAAPGSLSGPVAPAEPLGSSDGAAGENGPEAAAQPPQDGEKAAPSTPAEQADEDPVGTLGELVAAVRAGQWRAAAALALALLMLALAKARNWGPAQRLFGGDRGGAILVMLLSLAGGLSTALASEAPLDWKLFLGVVTVAFTAVGGYTWIKRLIWPADKA